MIKVKTLAISIILSLLLGLGGVGLIWRTNYRSTIHVAITNLFVTEVPSLGEHPDIIYNYKWKLWNPHSQKVPGEIIEEWGPFSLMVDYQNGTSDVLWNVLPICFDHKDSWFTFINPGLTQYSIDLSLEWQYPVVADGVYTVVPSTAMCSQSHPESLIRHVTVFTVESGNITVIKPILPKNFGKIDRIGQFWLFFGFSLIVLPWMPRFIRNFHPE